ncbi:hypothetical protein [Vibrio sagamiensis]|uniref:Uncharacterized protein n=1 Tax=Vibrio sagamiensis NBRC 104589 TaxID=1219064 RepID=A0A511QKZ5_9VIBR|nr:hypothetical protein [Vibrio sagamiensis]PNQ53656.1 hypothetical protein C1141_20110 [Vibrio agarivorans]GEM77706.1 hypothetical protein VSA01S_38180 [Vibrio sagamiensis NBRC 104589]
MKLTTTLLATLIFASTGAIANTTKLTEQDELLIQRAERTQFRHCVSKQLEKLSNSPELQMDLGVAYEDAVAIIEHFSERIPHHSPIPFSTSTAAIMLVSSCIAPAKN